MASIGSFPLGESQAGPAICAAVFFIGAAVCIRHARHTTYRLYAIMGLASIMRGIALSLRAASAKSGDSTVGKSVIYFFFLAAGFGISIAISLLVLAGWIKNTAVEYKLPAVFRIALISMFPCVIVLGPVLGIASAIEVFAISTPKSIDTGTSLRHASSIGMLIIAGFSLLFAIVASVWTWVVRPPAPGTAKPAPQQMVSPLRCLSSSVKLGLQDKGGTSSDIMPCPSCRHTAVVGHVVYAVAHGLWTHLPTLHALWHMLAHMAHLLVTCTCHAHQHDSVGDRAISIWGHACIHACLVTVTGCGQAASACPSLLLLMSLTACDEKRKPLLPLQVLIAVLTTSLLVWSAAVRVGSNFEHPELGTDEKLLFPLQVLPEMLQLAIWCIPTLLARVHLSSRWQEWWADSHPGDVNKQTGAQPLAAEEAAKVKAAEVV
ncbi:hypothetical protein V8C86DRAFT_2550679 [Haematococcus lacustris]